MSPRLSLELVNILLYFRNPQSQIRNGLKALIHHSQFTTQTHSSIKNLI
ncbi:MAG: hypothetical protein ACOVQ4_22985 [Flectobacillus sp.]